MNKKAMRLDVAIFQRGLSQSREQAQAIIMSGNVYVDGVKATKAGMSVTEKQKINVQQNALKYVSRGGLKLEKAVEVFGLNLKDKVCLDIGASTGGFTDCMLQNGARKVYAVDVGYGQLAWKLRTDEDVINLERTNFRHITSETITEPINFASIDVSFISLKLIFPALEPLLVNGGQCVALIKPQFEAGREHVGKKGVVRSQHTHIQVIENVLAYAEDNRLSILNIDFSPIKGPEGNIEYLLFLEKNDNGIINKITKEKISQIVEASHDVLSKKNGKE